MHTKTFLQTVLGDEGWYCVWGNRLSDSARVQKFYPTIDAVLETARNLDAEGYDAYFALATFVEDGSRTAANAKELKALFLDLDCGPTKDYMTQADALAALRTFCKSTGFPRPTVVNSGRGIHAYWPLVKPVPATDWKSVADMFKVMCKRNGLNADPAVTSDPARILRVPGTHNYKDNPPKDVGLVGEASDAYEFEALSRLIEESDDTAILRPRSYTPAVTQDALMMAIAGNYTSRFKTIMLKTVQGNGCAQLGEVVLNQQNVSEPLWRAGLSVAKFCVDGDKAIHKISEKHEGYSASATEEKANLIKGPYLCSTFDEFRPNVCPDCRHWNKIKSPISIGREVEEATEEDNVVVQTPMGVAQATPITYTIPTYPQPYFRGKNGGVFKHDTDDAGDPKDKLVYVNDLYVTRRLKDIEAGESLVMRLHLPKDGTREFTVPLTAVGTRDEFRKCLAMQGVAVLNVQELMEYTMKWVSELQFRTEAEEACRQFGWVDDDATVFAAGDALIYGDRVEINAPSSATAGLFPYFKPRGTLEGWKETMRFYNRPGMELHQYMVGLSFAAPLMMLTPINACAFHAWSKESGLGKTTGMIAGASVWGDPDWIMMQERDTTNSKMNRMEVYKNLPCYMDEMTNTNPKELSDFAYQLPSGLQRNRMGAKANTERARGKPWQTVVGTTGNTSMIERMSLYKPLPKAEAMRILECKVDRVAFDSKEETDRFAAAVKDNFGHAGVVYIQYLINHMAEAAELRTSVQKKLDLAAGLSAEHRFWSVQAACDITGLMLAKRAGLIDWEIGPIVAFIVTTMTKAKHALDDIGNDVESVLNEYLTENYNSMLRIKSTEDIRGKPTDMDKIIVPEDAPRGNNLVARYEYDVKRLFLLPKPLRTWCVKQQINYQWLLDELKAGRTKAQRQKIRLSKGTYMSLPPSDTIVIDCSGFMTDEVEDAMAASSALFAAQSQAE